MATKDRLQDRGGSQAHEPEASAARWAWIASAAFLAGSAALAVAPRVVHSAGPLALELNRMGLTWPLLAGFGVVIAAVASTTRRTRAEPLVQPAAESESPASNAPDPLAREISAELARVRGGLHDMRVEFVYVKDALSRLVQTTSQTDSDSNHDAEAAIFRLAASLDQLGGRIEHELGTQRTWLASALDDLARSNHSASAGSQPSMPAFADPYTQGFEGAAHEIHLDEGYTPSDDDVHVEVSLESEPHWLSGLGVLDEIDEPRAPLSHAKTSPSARPTSADALLGEIGSHGAMSNGIGEKMAQLRELLSDPAVQRALESQAR